MSGKYYLLDASDGERWQCLLEEMAETDVFFEPSYFSLYKDEGEAKLFVYEKDNETVIYPFILRKINSVPIDGAGEIFDITSPYGYGGPLCSAKANEQILKSFNCAFEDFCREEKIITEFIRFHPMLENHVLMNDLVSVERHSTIIYIDLKKSETEIWGDYEYSNQKNIKKAMRSGIRIYFDRKRHFLDDFLAIYKHTLERRNAGGYYFFPREFFERIHTCLPDNHIYVHALLNDKVVSTELLLYNQNYIHSFLGGTYSEYFIYRPNNMLKHEIIHWAKERGIKYFLLGGGKSDGDGIFTYKKTFAKNSFLNYYIGKKIHDIKTFQILMNGIYAANPDENFFPPYRGYLPDAPQV